jgi:hypothetical protein
VTGPTTGPAGELARVYDRLDMLIDQTHDQLNSYQARDLQFILDCLLDELDELADSIPVPASIRQEDHR